MKIYTKSGDQGKTGLISGKRVSKASARIAAYGSVDELNAHLGMIRDLLTSDEHTAKTLIKIQERLFEIGSQLAADDPPEAQKFPLPQIREEDIRQLELEMDCMDEALPPLKNFILPGGHPTISHIQIARTVCRRAERETVSLRELEEYVPEKVIQYLNRLSDYLFVLARKVSLDLGVKETPWIARST